MSVVPRASVVRLAKGVVPTAPPNVVTPAPFTTERARGVATASLSTVLANVTLPPAVLFASKSAVNTTALP